MHNQTSFTLFKVCLSCRARKTGSLALLSPKETPSKDDDDDDDDARVKSEDFDQFSSGHAHTDGRQKRGEGGANVILLNLVALC